ncbi:hypothetical protein A3D88_04130 [Candidatus Peribacteria bacterium RIFCSPHIGHO2_02_FULL_52_16]|nr:MAG: hypothetical protein A2706_03485 [Candidatus Peribacteria bacterium RIFCSPHIGHO2_01_FULL_51_35]OGJ60760.1 MAG: hypothetical protein A3D88_04130 [Candidatus Peribacteria bacterium RIFCSPHIGHO2_02_FULL_52_16]
MPETKKKPAGKGQKDVALHKHPTALRVQKTMPVREIVTLLPESEPILAEYGLHCFHCAANAYETLEEGCLGHGFEAEAIDELVEDLQNLLDAKPPRPETLTVTLDAAKTLKRLAEEESRTDQGLMVTLDENGGFCLEFSDTTSKELKTFTHAEEPTMKIFASTMTLARIGGATIDFREGRFKLDLPADETGLLEESKKNTCTCGGKCGCGESCAC